MTSAAVDCPVIDQDLTDWDFVQDPYPHIEQWRSLGPVVYNSRHDDYLVMSHRNNAKVLGNVDQFNSQAHRDTFIRAFGGVTMEALDSPRHHDVRRIWAEFFQRGSLESQRRLVGDVVSARMDQFLERLRSGEIVDAIPNLTRPIPTLIIAHLLGIELDMIDQFSAWSDTMSAGAEGPFDPTERGQKLMADGAAATHALNAYMAEAIKRRRADPGDDLVSMMVHHEFAPEMDEEEIIANNTQLVFAGNETTSKLMAITLVTLGQHPDQRRMLTEDRSLIPQAVEEIHRWQTLVQTNIRNACSDVSVIEGVHIPDGAEMRPLLGAANRDPERWERADQLDVLRPMKQHLGFGFGMHSCLGMNLARLEIQIWLNQLLDKVPDYELAGDIDWGRNFMIRGPREVPVQVEAS